MIKRNPIMKMVTVRFLIFMFFFCFITGVGFSQEGVRLKVGIYQNEPKIFLDKAGIPSGFWVDILDHIAEKEGWFIEYIPGTWEECKERLEEGTIDIMPDVAFTEDRLEMYAFTNESVYTSWSGIYTKSKGHVESVLDLDGKRIAVMRDSVNYIGNSGIQNLLKAFDIECVFVEKSSYLEAFEAVQMNEADAAVTSKDFAISNLQKYEMVNTPIIFQPATLFFAFPKDAEENKELINAIDSEVKRLKSDTNSLYYQLMEKWFNVESNTVVIPQWLNWILLICVLFIVMLIAGSYLLRVRVRERTEELTREVIEREKFEGELKENKKQLEKIVDSRTAELKRSNEELERFAYITSHDLQEPLRMIASYLQLIESRYSDKLDEDGHDFINFAVDGAKRMQKLINDLLKYSRLDTRKKEHRLIDCNVIVEDVLSNLEIAIEESDAEIVSDKLPVIWGDDTQMRQLFQNLIGNAIKFKGEKQLKIAVGAIEEDWFWRFFVKDNGIGIDKKYHERIFQVFQRLHGGGTYPGNGIGLAICKKIAERHGGIIEVESIPGKGSVFSFTVSKKREGRDE